ncbi:hypothetical protein TNCV_4770791 [Trichonephila clavipes]|nr:hypothetical protein TNCV_4770791 [Trichonephila clavipes]
MVSYEPSIMRWCPVLLKPHAAQNKCEDIGRIRLKLDWHFTLQTPAPRRGSRILVSLKTRPVEGAVARSSIEAQTSSHSRGVEVRKEECLLMCRPHHLNHDSKGRGPSPKTLV